MKRKLLPALYRLNSQGHLNSRFQILAVGRNRDHDDESFRTWARRALNEVEAPPEGEAAAWCDRCLHYHSIGKGERDDYGALAARIEEIENSSPLPGNRVLYLALPPSAFAGTIHGLGNAGLHKAPGWSRLVVEKPFGRDLASALELNQIAHRYFEESQIYRIDHYLGKETVQNLLVLRFANTVFESSWNRDRVESVQITVAEDLGIEERARHYDQTGALRDMVQNHLSQLLALTAMEVPGAFEPNAIRHEKVKVLRAVAPIREEDVVFGQYGTGKVNGRVVPAYLEEPGIDSESSTETFVGLRLNVETWRWQGVPFYLRTGKRLPRRLTQINVNFRCPPVTVFHPYSSCGLHSNSLVITLQPNEGFDLCFEVKSPGQVISLKTQRLRFRYADVFGELPDAYETLLLDVVRGDQTLFVHSDEVEASWRIYSPLLERKLSVRPYAAGSWGPPQAEELMKRHGHEWLVL